jgi:hypothetical protein
MTPRFLDNKEFTVLSFFMKTPPVSLSRNRARDTRAGRSGDYRMAPKILKPGFTRSILGRFSGRWILHRMAPGFRDGSLLF